MISSIYTSSSSEIIIPFSLHLNLEQNDTQLYNVQGSYSIGFSQRLISCKYDVKGAMICFGCPTSFLSERISATQHRLLREA
jgi:hypothetical protein